MESDDRFKHLSSDPRFKILRNKQKKVQIDERFQSMFTDKKFTLKYSKDKRGRTQKKTSGDDLKKYYSQESDGLKKKTAESKDEGSDEEDAELEEESVAIPELESTNESEEEEDGGESERESDVESEDEDEDNGSKSPSDLSSSSDESESEAEVESGTEEVDVENIKFDWQPLDHDAVTTDTTTRRLAIQNLDWDHLDVKDVFTLVNSIRTPLSVKIYVSEFGKERMKQEALNGPKEIVEMPQVDEEEEEYNQLKDKMRALKNLETKTYKVNEYEDADEELDPKNEEMRERIRKYQLSRMKYHYAVAEFDSVESSELVYSELDGMEYEGSSLELDLRFIPDDIEFDPEDVRAECNKVPDLTSYKAPQFINTALQQTTVKFTWDETDIKRQEKLSRAYTKEELEKDDLAAYLASETESESEEIGEDDESDTVSVVTANSEARVNKYKMLLKSLEEEAEKKKKVDVDVEWGNFSEDEEEEAEEMEDNESNSDREEQPQVRRANGKTKSKAKVRKRDKIEEEKKKTGEDEEEDALDLLVMEDASVPKEEFKFDPDDNRFSAVYESGLYNIDPSNPNYKRTQALEMIAKKKREKRQKTSSQ